MAAAPPRNGAAPRPPHLGRCVLSCLNCCPLTWTDATEVVRQTCGAPLTKSKSGTGPTPNWDAGRRQSEFVSMLRICNQSRMRNVFWKTHESEPAAPAIAFQRWTTLEDSPHSKRASTPTLKRREVLLQNRATTSSRLLVEYCEPCHPDMISAVRLPKLSW